MARSSVPFYPVLGPRQCVGTARDGLPGALGAPGAVPLRFARTGLRLIASALPPGSRVLLPDLLCESAVEPFAAAGLAIDRYPVSPSLQAEPSVIRDRLRPRTGAVMVVSYFGLSQPFSKLGDLCEERNVVLIDDAAHSLLSELQGRPYGTLGTAGVVSARKSLAVPDGAAVLGPRGAEHLGATHRYGAIHYLIRTLARHLDLATGVDVLGRRARRRSGVLPEHDGPRVHEGTGWSWLSQRVLRRVDPEVERRLRRQAFAAWDCIVAGRGGTPLVGPDLPAGVAPSGYPVRVDDEVLFADRMRELRVQWIRWPDRPETCAAHPAGVAVLPTHTLP